MKTVKMMKGQALGKSEPPRSVVVFGPKGCGKTTYAALIAKALGLTKIIDDAALSEKFPSTGVLVMTSEIPCSGPLNLRAMPFEEAVKLVHINGWPFPLNAMSISTEQPIHHNTKLSTLAAGLTLNVIDKAVHDAICSLRSLRDIRIRLMVANKKRGNRAAVRGHKRAGDELLQVEMILNAISESEDLPY